MRWLTDTIKRILRRPTMTVDKAKQAGGGTPSLDREKERALQRELEQEKTLVYLQAKLKQISLDIPAQRKRSI